MNNVLFPAAYFPDPDNGYPVGLGFVYIGTVDLDPTIEANRITVYLIEENGNQVTILPAAQPLELGAGGVVLYNGSPVQVQVNGNYSMTVQDSNLVQKYYFADSSISSPILTVEDFGAVGDGTTNDAAAFNLAAASGLRVYLTQNRQYRLNSMITMTAGSGFIGDGSPKILVYAANFTNTTSNTFTNNSCVFLSSGVDNTLFDGFTIQADFEDTQNIWTAGIAMRNADDWNIRNINFTGWNAGYMVAIDSCEDWICHNTAFYDCTVDATASAQMSAIAVDDNKVASATSKRGSIKTFRCRDLLPASGFFTSYGWQTDGINIQDGEGITVDDVVGLRVGELFDIWSERCTISNFIVDDCWFGLKLIHGAKLNTITNGVIKRANVEGISINGSDTGVRDTYGNSLDNILVTATGQGTYAFSSRNAVVIDDSGNTYLCVSNVLTNISVTDNATAGYAFVSSGTGTDNVVRMRIAETGASGVFINSNTSMNYGDSDTLGNSATRRVSFNAVNGVMSQRYDDNGLTSLLNLQNYGITGANGGAKIVTQFGASSALGNTASEINTLSTADWSSAGNRSAKVRVSATNANTLTQIAEFHPTLGFYPVPDGTLDLGGASNKWGTVYAATGAINTSDGRQKQDIRSATDKERDVAIRIKSSIRGFKYNDAVDRKGEKARVHFGTTTQLVKEAFEQEGLDPNNYGLFCYDEWDYRPEIKDKDGVIVQAERQAGNAYGLRYDELICFILSAI